MAKQNISFGERHLEKLVVGVTGAVLAGVLFLYVFQSPFTVEVNGETLGPSGFYSMIDDQATQTLQRIKNAPEPDPPEWEAPKTPTGKAGELPVVFAPVYPEVPALEGSFELSGKLELAEILPPGKPSVTAGRATALLPPANINVLGQPNAANAGAIGVGQEEDHHWVAVFASLNRRAQQEQFIQAKYDVGRQVLIVTRIEAERQRLLPDGNWEEPAQQVTPQHVANVLVGRTTVPLEDDPQTGGKMIPPAYYDYMENLKETAISERNSILRPNFQQALPGDFREEWKVPKRLDPGVTFDWQQDYNLLAPAAEEGQDELLKPGPGGWLDWRKIKPVIEKKIADGDIIEAGNLLADVVAARQLLERDQEDAEQMNAALQPRIEQALQKERERQEARRAIIEANLGPEMDVCWFTDTTAKPGETYRYRLRVLAYNPHAGLIAKLRDPEDAAKVILAGEWSEWSDPIALPPAQYLFFTLVDAADKSARLELYNWENNEWKKGIGTLGLGQAIDFEDRYQRFRYDGVIVAMESGRMHAERNADPRRGVRYRDPRETEAVTLVTASGDVEERLVARDMAVRREKTPELTRRREVGQR